MRQEGIYSIAIESKADRNGIIDQGHLFFVQVAHMLTKPFFIDGTYLLQQDHRVLTQAHTATGNVYMGRKPGFSC